MITHKEMIVVGAGPAGIEAAIVAANSGVEVTLIDTARRPGGQYFQQLPVEFRSEEYPGSRNKGERLFRRLEEAHVHLLSNTLVWGIFQGERPDEWYVTLYAPDLPTQLSTNLLVLAPGAYDRTIPFPGWDLPGVMTAGASMIFVKKQHVLPGKRFILSGTGPLQLAAAAQLVQAGAKVMGVHECVTGLPWRGIPFLPAMWGQWGRMWEGFDYMRILIGAGVPYRTGWAVVEARGCDRVEEAIIARLDSTGTPIPGSEKVVAVDTVVVGYGLLPSTELSRLLECETEYVTERGGFVPRRNQEMQTSLPGVYVVGDGAGIGGAEMAMIEGRIAGWSAACHAGKVGQKEAQSVITSERNGLKREQRFSHMLGSLFTPPRGLHSLAKDETIICRCEQVTLGQIRDAIKLGTQTVNDVKNLTRCGMGNCQGRVCGEKVASILASEIGCSLQEARYYNVRPPVHPLPLNIIEEIDTTHR